MQRIVSKNTAEALQEIITESFAMTAKIDRIRSILDTLFSCNNTSRLIHHCMAHMYSGYFADEIADLGLQGYDIAVEYGGIPKESKNYSSVKEIVEDLLENAVKYQTMLNGCYKISFDNNDLHVCADLIEIIKRHNNIVRQSIILVNKIDLYGDNITAFDHDIKDFWILGDYQ